MVALLLRASSVEISVERTVVRAGDHRVGYMTVVFVIMWYGCGGCVVLLQLQSWPRREFQQVSFVLENSVFRVCPLFCSTDIQEGVSQRKTSESTV